MILCKSFTRTILLFLGQVISSPTRINVEDFKVSILVCHLNYLTQASLSHLKKLKTAIIDATNCNENLVYVAFEFEEQEE
mmetsp:Transcript_31447/g.58246  ORF Transcript_31447/g.58246 Transcript_31447/m.58246 type:complete len:80 (-) Transcript_31447:653-892(-)